MALFTIVSFHFRQRFALELGLVLLLFELITQLLFRRRGFAPGNFEPDVDAGFVVGPQAGDAFAGGLNDFAEFFHDSVGFDGDAKSPMRAIAVNLAPVGAAQFVGNVFSTKRATHWPSHPRKPSSGRPP